MHGQNVKQKQGTFSGNDGRCVCVCDTLDASNKPFREISVKVAYPGSSGQSTPEQSFLTVSSALARVYISPTVARLDVFIIQGKPPLNMRFQVRGHLWHGLKARVL